jgi:hypothetical protein
MENLKNNFSSLQEVMNYLTENQQVSYAKCLLDVEKNKEKISKFIEIAVKNRQKQIDNVLKSTNLELYDSYKGLYVVFNHLKKGMQDAKIIKTGMFTNKFNATNLLSLIDFNTVVSIKNLGLNYGTKKHFSALFNAIVKYSSLEIAEQSKVDELSQSVNDLLKSERLNLDDLFAMYDDVIFTKQTAKYAFNNDLQFFDKRNLIELYDFEYEEGLKEAKRLEGLKGAERFITDWRANLVKIYDEERKKVTYKPRTAKSQHTAI